MTRGDALSLLHNPTSSFSFLPEEAEIALSKNTRPASVPP